MSNMKTKIQALIAKAEGTDNEHESAIFMAKAIDLMQKHQIELHDLNVDDKIHVTIGMTATRSAPSWKRKILSALAQYYGCQTVLDSHYIKTKTGKRVPGYSLELVGPESARVTTELMFPFVIKQIMASGNKLARKRVVKLRENNVQSVMLWFFALLNWFTTTKSQLPQKHRFPD